VAKDYDRNEV
jgi:hypothetical protein